MGPSTPIRRVAPRTRLTTLAVVLGTLVTIGMVVLNAACDFPAATFSAAEEEPAEPAPATAALCGQSAITLDAVVAAAEQQGDTVSLAILDRSTGTYTSSTNDTQQFAGASLAKLFIADDVLYQASTGQDTLDPETRASVATMLEASDDAIATWLWANNGGPEIVTRVAERYGLPDTGAADWDWWFTSVSARDLTSYFDHLLDGTGGLPAQESALIVGALRSAQDTAVDGFDQHFGVWDTVSALGEAGIKDGWMTLGSTTIRHSAGFAGEGGRFVVVELAELNMAAETTYDDIVNTAASDRATELVEDALGNAVTVGASVCAAPVTIGVLPHTASPEDGSDH